MRRAAEAAVSALGEMALEGVVKLLDDQDWDVDGESPISSVG